MDHVQQTDIERAERSLPIPPEKRPERRARPFKTYSMVVLALVFILVAGRILLLGGGPVEPSYEYLPPDSASITEAITTVEEYVSREGDFPPGLMERIENSEDLSLMINEDGSFTYVESSIVYRSAPGIVTTGGSHE